MRIFLLILALSVMGPGDAKKKGRRANALYEKAEFSLAASLYRQGVLDVQEKGPGSIHAGLLNNLGASLFKQGDFEQAASAFASSSRMADNRDSAVRANYNAGNAAAMQQELETALDFYKSALLSDPDNEDAKFNYEFVKRQLEEQQQQQEQDPDSDQKKDQNQQENDQKENQDQNQDQQQQQDSDQNQQQDQQQDPSDSRQQQNPNQLSPEEALRILQALENEEEQLLRQIQKMKTRPRRVEKDW